MVFIMTLGVGHKVCGRVHWEPGSGLRSHLRCLTDYMVAEDRPERPLDLPNGLMGKHPNPLPHIA